MLLALPYLEHAFGLRSLRQPGGRRRRLVDGFFVLRRDAVETAALVRGSVRARTPVL